MFPNIIKRYKYKFAIITLLITLMICVLSPSANTPVHAALNFVDTVGHWADEEIRAAVDHGYINGYPDGRFRPDDSVKRAEFVKIINKAMYFNVYGNIAFRDVPPNSWYYDEIRIAAAAGYIAGYDDGSIFMPESPITREEAAVVLARVSPGDASTRAPRGLKDAADISDWAVQAVNLSYSKAYLTGFPDGNFYPQRNLTRAETVKVVNKLLSIDSASQAIYEIDTDDTRDVSTIVNIKSRLSGTLYWALLYEDDVIPSAVQVSQGQDGYGVSAFRNGNTKITAYETAMLTLSTLAPSTYYRICFTVKGSDGKFSNVRDLRFRTRSESSMGEDWISTFRIDNVYQNSVTLTARSDERSTLYWVIVESSASGEPSPTNITAGNDMNGDPAYKSGSFSLQRNASDSVDITGLKPGTRYYVYGYAAKSSTEFSTVRSTSFTTSGVNTPSISSFSASFNNDDVLQISFRINTDGNFYWIAVEESGSASSVDAGRIKSGAGNASQTIADKGNRSVAGGVVTITKAALSISDPLQPNKKYRIYACAEGPAGSLSGVVNSGIIEKSTVAAGLSNLVISVGNRVIPFTFDPDKYDYDELAIPNGNKAVLIRPTAPSGTDIIVNGKIASSNSYTSVDLPADSGTSSIMLIEVSEAGKNKKTYRIPIKENKPEVTSVYVAGSDNINPKPDTNGNYEVNVPESYQEITMSIEFSSEMTGYYTAPGGASTQIRNGERRIVALSGQDTEISLEVRGPTGESRLYSLTVSKTLS